MQNKKLFLIIGPPGSGKSSISKEVCKDRGSHFSIGEMYRQISAQKSELGRLVKSRIDVGKMVPAEIAREVIEYFLKEGEQTIVIDGFPRDLEQMHFFQHMLKDSDVELKGVIEIVVGQKTALERIRKRMRGIDDDLDLFEDRIKLFERDAASIRAFYSKNKLYFPVNGEHAFDTVKAEVEALIFAPYP